MLELSNISFKYPNGKIVFENLYAQFSEKGIYLLEGENGSGKTTLLRIIANLALPKLGTINFKGEKVVNDLVSYLPSGGASSFHYLTGHETLKLFSSLNHTNLEMLDWWNWFSNIESFKKALQTPYSDCSNGMKQIVNLARALTKEAEIFLFDEPLSGLDKNTKANLKNFLETFSKEKLIIITSHSELLDLKPTRLQLINGFIKNA